MNKRLKSIVNLKRYPIYDLNSPIIKNLIKKCKEELDQFSCSTIPNFILPESLKIMNVELEKQIHEVFMSNKSINPYLYSKDDSSLPKNHPKNELANKKAIFECKIINIKTFSDKTAVQVINGLDKFKMFLKIYNSKYTFNNSPEIVEQLSNIFQNKVYCFSGIRNKKVAEFIVLNGGKVESGIKSNVTDIIVKDITSKSQKIEKAKKKGINIIAFNSFIQNYNIEI